MRKAKPKKRQILPDPVFGDVKVTRFVNHLMYDGKKNTAFEIFYSALETVKGKLPNEEKSALEIWKAALDNITPQVEVKSRLSADNIFSLYSGSSFIFLNASSDMLIATLVIVLFLGILSISA